MDKKNEKKKMVKTDVNITRSMIGNKNIRRYGRNKIPPNKNEYQ